MLTRFWLADVANLFASGVDAASSVQARFTIRDRIPLLYISLVTAWGMPLAMLPLLVGSLILGRFAAVPLDKGPLNGAVVILGGHGYYLFQIPGEGVMFYEHGLIWSLC